MDNIKKQYEYYFTFDEPISYKNLNISPVLVKNYFDFFFAINCLILEKNKIPDAKIISMSYLDFLFYIVESNEDGNFYGQMFLDIMKLCCNLEPENIKYKRDEKGKIKLIINNVEYDKNDFDIIKQIICYQNMPDYNDEYIDPELEQALNEVNELQSQNKGSTSLEDQIICISISSSYKKEDIEKMTIRKFIKTLQKVDSKLHYQIYKTGECSGMVSFKEPITHWMYNKDNRFDSLISYDSFKEKMKQVT